MTIVRLGYVAMSVHLQNCSPSQTMTYAHFQKLADREAAIRRLESIAISNLENCLRLLKHNAAHDIAFFRLSSRLVPLATHEALTDWDYLRPLQPHLQALGAYADQQGMRLDFHPDHFVLLNTPKDEVLKLSLQTLKLHYRLLKGMGIPPEHRCVLHVGGLYNERDIALERFVSNWAVVPASIQQMIMLENDDKSFHLHHLAHHQHERWEEEWERVVRTWMHSPLPIKMHISSPKSERQFRHHADYVDVEMFWRFLQQIKGSVEMIDCMIEAKRKDDALFRLMEELRQLPDVETVDQATIKLIE
jgi:UV DNA damage endonuclease